MPRLVTATLIETADHVDLMLTSDGLGHRALNAVALRTAALAEDLLAETPLCRAVVHVVAGDRPVVRFELCMDWERRPVLEVACRLRASI